MEQDQSCEVLALSTDLLMFCSNKGIDENVGQAALGHAWSSLCRAMGISRRDFKDMCQGMIELYEEEA